MARETKATWQLRQQLDLRWKIRTNGFTVVHIGAECADPNCNCPSDPLAEQFAYTIGLTERRHPEVLVAGVSSGRSLQLLNYLGHNVVGHGQRYRPGQQVELGPFGVGRLVHIGDSSEQLIIANQFYRERPGPPIPALQLLITAEDRHN